MKKYKFLIYSIGLSILLWSCEKSVDEIPRNDPQVTADEALIAIEELTLANKMFQDAGNASDDALIEVEEDLGPGKTTNSPSISVTPLDLVTFPKTITVDFGNGITGPDGVHRAGIVQIVSTNWYKETNSTHTSTFNQYYQNGHKVEGTHVAVNKGPDNNGYLTFSVNVNNGKITTPTGKVINYSQVSTRKWIAGDNTPLYIWDDEYLLDGEQWGKSSNNVNYTLEVTDPLHFTLLPREIVDGEIDLDVGSFKNIMINYGSKTITLNGVVYPF